MSRFLIGLLAGALLGALGAGLLMPGDRGGLLASSSGSPFASPEHRVEAQEAVQTTAAAAAELARLREELRFERELRERMSQELAVLEDALQSPESEQRDPHQRAADVAAAHGAGVALPHDTRSTFRSAGLADLEMDPREIERIRQRWEQYVMDKLYLGDSRARGEVPDRRQRRADMLDLEASLREDLGETSYDAMLYATGQPNRVVLTEVLDESPGYLAGLRAGDAVVRYDDHRIYRGMELKSWTSRGEKGETVEVQVLRNGGLVRLFVDRGPLGVFFEVLKQEPY